MNNEPVAWMIETSDDIIFMLNFKGASKPDNSWDKVTPVYTHPAKTVSTPQPQTFTGENPFPAKTLTAQEVMEQTHKNISEAHWKAKTLTDEEILGAIARGWCSEKNSSKTMDSDLAMAIADEIKAILRKAQEK